MKRSLLILIGCGLLVLAIAAGAALFWYDSQNDQLSEAQAKVLFASSFAEKHDEAASNVFLADLTQDGRSEMIVVEFFGQDGKTPLPCHDGPAAMTAFGEASVTVYTIDKDEQVKKLYRTNAASAHAGWLQLYLVAIDGKSYLFNYAPTMYQGYGDYTADAFALDSHGDEVSLFHDELSFTPDEFEQQATKEKIAAFEQAVQTYLKAALPLIVIFDDKFEFTVSKAADALK